ncbi:hypothetical protein GGR57DRAFT_506829 [Xylariaceae sp. FL1272]|nr:hypothetical protein GGR57DRAFT_506829 [Xylariaceae sp. FL1272]
MRQGSRYSQVSSSSIVTSNPGAGVAVATLVVVIVAVTSQPTIPKHEVLQGWGVGDVVHATTQSDTVDGSGQLSPPGWLPPPPPPPPPQFSPSHGTPAAVRVRRIMAKRPDADAV